MVGEVGFSFGKGFVGGESFAVLAAIGDVVGKLIGGIGEDGGKRNTDGAEARGFERAVVFGDGGVDIGGADVKLESKLIGLAAEVA